MRISTTVTTASSAKTWNHMLASFPSPAEGLGFFTGLSQWGTDHLPLRDKAISIEDFISRNLFGEPPKLGEQQPQTGGPIPGPIGPTGPSASDEDKNKMRARGFVKVIEGTDGWLYLGYDVLGACLPEKPISEVIGQLVKLRQAVERSGRKFMLM